MDKHIVKGDVVGAHEEVGPAGRVQLRDALNTDPSRIVREEEDGSVECVVGILYSLALILYCDVASYQNLLACKIIIPLLTIAIQRALAKDLDILPAPNPERDGFLEIVVEVIGLPIFNVVGKLYLSASTSSWKTVPHTLISPSSCTSMLFRKLRSSFLPIMYVLPFCSNNRPPWLACLMPQRKSVETSSVSFFDGRIVTVRRSGYF